MKFPFPPDVAQDIVPSASFPFPKLSYSTAENNMTMNENCESLCGTCLWCLGFIAGAAHHLHALDTSDLAELVERWANSRGARIFAKAHNKYVMNIDVVRVRIGEELVDIRPKAALEVLIRGIKLPHTATEALAAIRDAGIK